MTRAMNDRQPLNLPRSKKSHVTSLLPHCGKDVLHLSHHLRNKHSNISVNDYNSVVGQVQNNYENLKRTGLLQEEGNEKQYKEVNAEEEKLEKIEKEKTIGAKCSTSSSEVLFTVSDPVGITSQSNDDNKEGDDRERDEEINESFASHIEEGGDSELDCDIEDGYSDEILRYLVHNTTPDGVRFFLTALRSGKTITQFSRSRLCRVILGEMRLSTLQCIYRHRKYLTSYYRLERYHPYPEKGMIHSCVACAATERGKCSCPVLPKSFYVFCRQKCSSDWNCAKRVNFDRGPSHACFDFFHCTICHERYVASTKHHPYPPLHWGHHYTIQ